MVRLLVLGVAMIPSFVDIGASRNVLPYGRYLASMDEAKSRFAPETDANRLAIWEEFCKHAALARSAFGKVAGVWIGGSFITSEEVPHDIDVVYFVTEEAYKNAVNTQQGRFVISLLLQKQVLPDGMKPKVDAYLVTVPPTQYVNDRSDYMSNRGYWDQFWSKTRFENGNERWLYPAAGYLQVVIDGYDD